MLYLHGIGHFHPENIIDNAFLRDLDIGVDENWILQRVGIHSRRTVLPLDYIRATKNSDVRAASEAALYSNAQTGAFAACKALERAGIKKSQIGMVIAGGCSPQWLIPAEACAIAAKLEIEAVAFDLNSACSSFAVQLFLIAAMAPEMLPDYILVVNAENNTRCINYGDRSTAVLWGDCSTAAIVSRKVPSRTVVHCSSPQSLPADWNKVTIRVGSHFNQDGNAVQAFAVRTMCSLLKSIRPESSDASPYFIGHQANLTALNSVCRFSHIPAEKHLYNVDRFGNCGAAGAPSVLSETWDGFHPGDSVAMAVVGSGLTWAGLRLEFQEADRGMAHA